MKKLKCGYEEVKKMVVGAKVLVHPEPQHDGGARRMKVKMSKAVPPNMDEVGRAFEIDHIKSYNYYTPSIGFDSNFTDACYLTVVES